MIRVLIERRLAEGVEEDLQRAMREMRREAIHVPGYLSGETLRSISDPNRYVIISSWRSQADWEAWSRSETRRRIEEHIAPLLAEPEQVMVFEPV
jgi:heme-degrading monooxygenase HmoA